MGWTDFARAFHDGERVDVGIHQVTMRLRTLGELVLTSGKIVACDPFVFPDADPFTVAASAGRYPVIVSVAHFGDGVEADQRVACAMLRLREAEPVRWEMATVPGQDPATLEEGYIFGYPVDAGTGCFMDAEAAQDLAMDDVDGGHADTLLEEMDKTQVPTWAWADLEVRAATGANVIAFSAGFGDGFYASYWGYDADDKPVCLVTDFGVLNEEE
jgi:hypothetical protein